MKTDSLFKPFMRYASLVILFPHANRAFAAMTAEKDDSKGVTQWAISYGDELLIAACLFLLVLGSIMGMFYRTPVYGGKELTAPLKLLASIAGGFIAFLYCLHVDRSLTFLTPIYVAGVSFIFPALVHLVHAICIKYFGMKTGLSRDIEALMKDQGT